MTIYQATPGQVSLVLQIHLTFPGQPLQRRFISVGTDPNIQRVLRVTPQPPFRPSYTTNMSLLGTELSASRNPETELLSEARAAIIYGH